MKRYFSFIAATILAMSCVSSETDFTAFVDTSIGTGGHGHVFVGASVPFGAIQLGPTSIPQSWDWCSGYHQSDSSVIGFSHTHLSGTGIGDLFDITVLPVTGPVTDCSRESIADKTERSTEICTPGYYKAHLEKSGVTVELTATQRVGLHKYIFEEKSEGNALIIDLENGGCWDTVTQDTLTTEGRSRIEGFRFSKGWADNQKIWFSGEFSVPFESCTQIAPHHWKISFPASKEVLLKLSVSPASCDGARNNILAELPDWNFENTKRNAADQWNRELSKVEIETADTDARKIFYTALYHTMIAPSLFCDNGQDARYTTFSLWDTYRAQMPLFSIIHSEKENDIMQTFLDIYHRQGKLPVWHLHGCETNCMVGNPGIAVAADAILKGFDGFNVQEMYEAMKASALRPDRGQNLRMQYGYIPSELFNESVAYDLEYALADWALAQVAAKLDKRQDYEYFLERSKSYRKHFDPESGFIRGVTAKGNFREPFNPYYSDHRNDDYCEGNAWQYTWLVPHDFEGLVDCFGSKEEFCRRLDMLFSAEEKIDGENSSSDISGMIGQYAHGNEPSHHITYFYTMAGQPWKTADLVRRICSELYSASPDGLSGNEDVGQMSAWYILSTIGFYQVEPAGGRYYFGSPLFDSVRLNLDGGKKFTVVAENNSKDNRYIQEVFLNGEKLSRPYIDYKEIMAGGELLFKMGPELNP